MTANNVVSHEFMAFPRLQEQGENTLKHSLFLQLLSSQTWHYQTRFSYRLLD